MKYFYLALIFLHLFIVLSGIVMGAVWGYIGEYGKMGIDWALALFSYVLAGYWFHRLDRLEEYGRN